MAFFDHLRRTFQGHVLRAPDHGHGGDGGHGHGDVDCQEAVKLLYDYLDGELDGVSADHVRAHFEMCRMCYPHLRFEESFRAAIQRAGEGGAAPDELKEKLRALLRDA